MYDFIRHALYELKNSLWLAVLLALAAAAWGFFGRKKRPLRWKRTALWMLFGAYFAVLLYATLLRGGGGYREWNLHLFRAWREAWNNFSVKNWANILLNIALFIPMGFLLPVLLPRLRRGMGTAVLCAAATLAVELAQLLLARGIFDVDDLFANALGGIMGWLAFRALWSLSIGRGKAFFGWAGLALLPAAAIGGIFLAYELQEFGNLPDAAPYRVDLNHLQWSIACDISDEADPASVYRAEALTTADCDAFAEEMAERFGAEVDVVSYYQEFSYYNFDHGILRVNYYDGSYSCRVHHVPLSLGDEPDRQAVEQALVPYGIVIPADAEFSVGEDGMFCFTCDRVTEGGVMYDGALSVEYSEANRYPELSIENSLVRYTYYSQVEVLSPAEALCQLKNGNFAYADALAHYSDGTVTVTSCVPGYAVDTKGFYQLVYYFTVESGDYADTVMIPAM